MAGTLVARPREGRGDYRSGAGKPVRQAAYRAREGAPVLGIGGPQGILPGTAEGSVAQHVNEFKIQFGGTPASFWFATVES